MYEIILPGYCFRYDNKRLAYEVFEVLCTTYEHDARISLHKDGKEVQYALIDGNTSDYTVVKVA